MTFTRADEFFGFCDQTFIETCPVLNGYELLTASNLKNVKIY